MTVLSTRYRGLRLGLLAALCSGVLFAHACAPAPAPTPTPVPTVTTSPTPTVAPLETLAPGMIPSKDDVPRIEALLAKALMDAGQAVLYDVRTTESYEVEHAAGAQSLPKAEIEARASSLPKDKLIIFYCV